jgi:hypothetical protein
MNHRKVRYPRGTIIPPSVKKPYYLITDMNLTETYMYDIYCRNYTTKEKLPKVQKPFGDLL